MLYDVYLPEKRFARLGLEFAQVSRVVPDIRVAVKSLTSVLGVFGFHQIHTF